MNLSVIIPTKNRAVLLGKALESILTQSLSQNEFEVIIVDNGSIDNTKEIFLEYKPKIKNISYFYEKEPGLHVGRHKGMKEARSDILVYLDDDVELFPQHLKNVLESFKDNEVVLVGGKNLPKYETTPPNWIEKIWNRNTSEKFIWSLSILDFGDEIKEIDANYVFGCNFSIRKEILIQTQGFHPDAMPYELIKYRGDGETYVTRYVNESHYKAVYNPLVSIYHFVPNTRMTEEYFCKRNYEKGVSDAFTDIRSSKDSEKINHFVSKLKRDNSIFIQSYLKGYLFLIEESKKDKEVLKWIHKKNYL
ncbi:glycosyltransferase family 2 protein [Aliarcobacter skirrowii]|uniref:glycosyltransferase family 2 protein n=1 Tax=Aliarcobacter skirrowii TaxID=28200 RepID=UPI00082C5097|nr:glycosyltransferase family 2 protein [Aliarcobacter skirrowii]